MEAKMNLFNIDLDADNVKFQNWCDENQKLFESKNFRYGGAYKYTGLLGCIFQIFGISMRITMLSSQNPMRIGEEKEALEDALRDLHNYANMALICLQEENYFGKFFGG
jgi:hypothetical protein